jgi:Cd2+/Zn2+-exporting ATPase
MLRFKVRGLDCADEIAVLKREVGPVVGGKDHLSFDLLNSKMTVALGSVVVTPEAVCRAVARTGMQAEVWQKGIKTVAKDGFSQRWGQTLLTSASGLCALAGFFVHAAIARSILAAVGSEGMGLARHVPVASQVLYGLAILTGAWYVLPRAWLAIRRLRPDMNLLMTVAVLGAVGIGDWFEAATVTFLFSLSLALEKWSVAHARRAVEALLDLTPPSARLLREDGSHEEVSPDQVPVGSVFLVKPGERLPRDGRVVRGSSHVNQAPITGESLPVAKNPGDPIFTGTVNGEGTVEVESTKPAGDTTLAHIIRMVGEAQSRRAPSEQWVEKFAQVYTPVVMGLALVFFVLPVFLLGGPWSEWFYRALVLLVIACPCALVISTPVSIVAAIAAAARHGVLVKGGAYIEAPGRLRAIAFDKTGTLTEGEPSVVAVLPLNGHTEGELLERVAGLEVRSEHPLGKAILAYAQERGVAIRPALDYQMIPGKGATARFNGEPYWLGSHRYLEERGQETGEVHAELEALSQEGRTVVIVGNERHVCGYIALADTVRPSALPAVQALRKMGVEKVVVLTGDNAPTAQAIALATGMDEVQAELLPADKVAAVETLVARHGQVAMVGDGVNDAPALARASVGIAMGAVGSDAAFETADIVLMSDDLARLPWLVAHSRRALGIIRQNIAFALSVKAIFVALAFLGFASLWAAIAADMGASLLVMFNGLRLLQQARWQRERNTRGGSGRWPLSMVRLALVGLCGRVCAAPCRGRHHNLGRGRQQVFRAYRPHSNGTRSQGHRHWPLRQGASSRLCRWVFHGGGDGSLPRLPVGVDSCRSCGFAVDPSDTVGRPDLAGRVARLQGVQGAGPLQADTGGLVARHE